MIVTLPIYRTRGPAHIFRLTIVIALFSVVFLIKVHFGVLRNCSVANEYFSSREAILSRIEAATARQDSRTLTQLRDRYGCSVRDNAFQSSLRRGLAKVAARDAELQLAMARHLDLARSSEEFTGEPPLPVGFSQAGYQVPLR